MLWPGYALSIYIPISFVCVVPYEAVRWAMIAVATVLSGLFLLLNFKGPIFDVAGAKCVLPPGFSYCSVNPPPPAIAAHAIKRFINSGRVQVCTRCFAVDLSSLCIDAVCGCR